MTSPKDQRNQNQGEIPPLTPEYYRARRQLILWSGILFAWELVGVSLEKLDTAAGNVGAVAKALKSPQAVPWVIVVLVAYFAYRIIVEWNQSNHERRLRVASQIDLWVSVGIALSSYILFFGQQALGIQLANILTWKASIGFGIIVTIGVLYFRFRGRFIQEGITKLSKYKGEEIKPRSAKMLGKIASFRATLDGIALATLGICTLVLLVWQSSRSIATGVLVGLPILFAFFVLDQWSLRRHARHERRREKNKEDNLDLRLD